ncbi:hypothetical protein GIB67_000584 [Kingdonia uniflora]|uniref:beta-galactosidase n=1 Tax=Kingdonia uniflora TaxID=39325 RepID=A0A7J7P361_9MAGN|nr:hypothetical protein GIB67_000584 [Kingdonia uniflora]
MAMQGLTQKIVQLMKSERLFDSQGGPIILSQELWITEIGGTIKQWPVQDLAYAVARLIQKGGSFVNYYMYHRGTNYGRTVGGPFITTTCEYDAPLDEYGLIRQPKYGQLIELHRAIKLCEKSLVSTDPVVTSLGSYQQVLDISFSKYNISRSIKCEHLIGDYCNVPRDVRALMSLRHAHVFSLKEGGCVAFLVNHNPESAKVVYNNKHYNLPPWSISILPDCEKVAIQLAFFLMFSSFRP